MRKSLPLLPLVGLVAACGGGGGGSSDGGTVITTPAPAATPTATPTPTPTATPTPAPTPTPTPTPTASGFSAQAAALYSTQPNIAGCQQGQLSSATVGALLNSVNAIRALHNLPAVTYSSSDEASAQAAALLQAANDSISHTPPTTWKCYTASGAAGAGSSNLYVGFGSGLTFMTDEQVLAAWMMETDNLVQNSVGHRRWILSPFLGSIAYGRVVGASPTMGRADGVALKVFNNVGSNVAGGALPAFVAYPYQDYPSRFFGSNALFSFGVIASTTPGSSANSAVNFASATVAVRQRGGAALTVSNISYDNVGYGLPNNIQFNVAGLQNGVYYDVTIDGVVVNGTRTSYTYYFRIV